MTNPPPNRVTVGGVTRFVAYTARGEWSGIHCECAACGTHFTIDRPYFYTDDDGDKQPLCDDCVRGDNAHPRFIWWFEVAEKVSA